MNHNRRVVANIALLLLVLLFVNDAANRWVAFVALAGIALLLVADFDYAAADLAERRHPW